MGSYIGFIDRFTLMIVLSVFFFFYKAQHNSTMEDEGQENVVFEISWPIFLIMDISFLTAYCTALGEN